MKRIISFIIMCILAVLTAVCLFSCGSEHIDAYKKTDVISTQSAETKQTSEAEREMISEKSVQLLSSEDENDEFHEEAEGENPEQPVQENKKVVEALTGDASDAYEKLCEIIREKGTESQGVYKYTEKINDISNVIFELDGEGKMTWSCTFEEGITTTVLTLSVKEMNETNDVTMTMIKNDTGDIFKWNGVLDTSTFNVTDFNAVDIQVASRISETDMLALKINTQITVLGADVVMTEHGLDGVSSFGFNVDGSTADNNA